MPSSIFVYTQTSACVLLPFSSPRYGPLSPQNSTQSEDPTNMADHRRDDDRDHGDGHGNRGHDDDDRRPRRQLIEPQFVATGLTMQGKEVNMADDISLLFPETSSGRAAIFTRGLGPCQSIATFNMASGDRSMIHLPAGTTTELFNDLMAGIAAATDAVVIFIVNGDAGNKNHFEEVEVPKFKKDINDALMREGKGHVIPRVRWISLWTDPVEDLQRRTVPGTFVLEASGRYGRGKMN